MALIFKRKPLPTTTPPANTGFVATINTPESRVIAIVPPNAIVPVIHETRPPGKHPLLTFCEWLEEKQPAWDYERGSPYSHLADFDPKTFHKINIGCVLTLEPDARISAYFQLSDEARYNLFHGLPINTTLADFTAACRKALQATAVDPAAADVRQPA